MQMIIHVYVYCHQLHLQGSRKPNHIMLTFKSYTEHAWLTNKYGSCTLNLNCSFLCTTSVSHSSVNISDISVYLLSLCSLLMWVLSSLSPACLPARPACATAANPPSLETKHFSAS